MTDYTLTRTTAPAENFIPDTQLWDHLALELTGSPSAPADAQEQRRANQCRLAAQGYMDGPQGVLGFCLVTQTWTIKLSHFPDEGIPLPAGPVQSVTSVTYTDTNGDSQVLASSAYTVVGIGDRTGGKIVPAYSTSWPSTRDVPEAVTVAFVAGVGTASAAAAAYPGAVTLGLLYAAEAFEIGEAGNVGYEIFENIAVPRYLNQLGVRRFG